LLIRRERKHLASHNFQLSDKMKMKLKRREEFSAGKQIRLSYIPSRRGTCTEFFS